MNNHDLHGGVPILQAKGKMGASVAAIARVLDSDGMLEVSVMNTPSGPKPALSRAAYLDGTELLDEIRAVIRAEIRQAFKEMRQKGWLDAPTAG